MGSVDLYSSTIPNMYILMIGVCLGVFYHATNVDDETQVCEIDRKNQFRLSPSSKYKDSIMTDKKLHAI